MDGSSPHDERQYRSEGLHNAHDAHSDCTDRYDG